MLDIVVLCRLACVHIFSEMETLTFVSSTFVIGSKQHTSLFTEIGGTLYSLRIERKRNYKLQILHCTRVSAQHSGAGSAHAKYSVSHHMVIKQFLLLGLAAECRSRRWV